MLIKTLYHGSERTKQGRLATMCRIKVKYLSRLFCGEKVGNKLSKVILNTTAKMMRGGTADSGENPTQVKAKTHVAFLEEELHKIEGGACRINERGLPDIFKVAVWGLSRLLLYRQVELFRKLPQSCSMKDPC